MRSTFKTFDDVISRKSFVGHRKCIGSRTNKWSKFSQVAVLKTGEKPQELCSRQKNNLVKPKSVSSVMPWWTWFPFDLATKGIIQGIESSTKLVPSRIVYKTSTKHHITNRWINQHLYLHGTCDGRGASSANVCSNEAASQPLLWSNESTLPFPPWWGAPGLTRRGKLLK